MRIKSHLGILLNYNEEKKGEIETLETREKYTQGQIATHDKIALENKIFLGNKFTIDEFFEIAYNQSYEDENFSGECNLMNLHRNWRKKWKIWLMFLVLGTANIGDATEYTSIGFLLADKEFQEEILNDETGSDGILVSIALIGLIIGGLLSGMFELSLGRKHSLLMGLGFNFFGGLFSALSFDIISLAMSRLISGLGIGAIISSLAALSSELAPPSRRGLFVGFVSSFWTVGSIGISLIAMLFFGKLHLHWRSFLIICALPAAICFIFLLFYIPESPRLLLLQGKYNEALANANYLARLMGYTGPTLKLDDLIISTNQDVKSEGDIKCALANIKNLYYIPNVRKNAIAIAILWSCISSGSIDSWICTIYEEMGIKQVYSSALLRTCFSIPGTAVATLSVDQLGRKKVFSFSMILSALTLMYFSWISFSLASSHSFQIISTSCLFSFFSASAWGSIGVMISEIFPTKIRSTGIGICATAARLSNICVQLIYGQLIERPPTLLLVASCFMSIGAITTLCIGIDEMARSPLEDVVYETSNESTESPKIFSEYSVVACKCEESIKSKKVVQLDVIDTKDDCNRGIELT